MTVLGRYRIHPGELLRLDLGRRIGLYCGRGRMLVTAGPEGRDHEMRPGDSLVCGGLVLVEGDGEVLVQRERVLFWRRGRERIELVHPRFSFSGETA